MYIPDDVTMLPDSELDKLYAEIERLKAEVARLREALESIEAMAAMRALGNKRAM